MDLAAILDTSRDAAVAVIGDICLDQYYFISDERVEVSLETGLRTNAVERFKHELGGAGNVAVNCRRLGGCRVDVYGIVGDDPYALILKKLFAGEGIGTDGLVTQKDEWASHVYHKVYDRVNELPRFDIGNYNHARKQSVDALLEVLREHIHRYNVLIINEQVLQGMHTPYMQEQLNALIDEYPDHIWITDCRNLHDSYRNTMHKLNNFEAHALYAGEHGRESAPAEQEMAAWLFSHWGQPLVITKGEDGAIVCTGEGITSIDGLHIIGQIDTVGAGDAFIAGLAVSLAGGSSLREAARTGNFSAGVSIQKLFETGHPAREEVLDLAAQADYRRRPELARDGRKAVYLPDSEIEIISPDLEGWFSGAYPEIAVFDHDGTISTLRHGWEAVMLEMMIRSMAGSSYNSLTAEQLQELEKQAAMLIEKTTGVQTIVQMQKLVELVRLHGYVREEEIRSPAAYKSIYNKMLMEQVDRRRARFASGHLDVEDVTIKGAVGFLDTLKEAGTRLFLASGTDQEDVREETELLGYKELFDGGVYGSVGDADNDPKRVVLQQIISRIESSGGSPERCIIFGDGPVEIREAKRHGIPAVGIISDEKQRYGMNPDKRERLILAGADLLIPDFSWIEQAGRWIGWRRA